MSSPLAFPIPGGVAVGALKQKRKHKRAYDAVITLKGPDCRPVQQLRFQHKPHPAHLALDFEDADHDDGCIRVAARKQVEREIAFAREHAAGSLLVHCYHGVGRSAGVALAVLAVLAVLDRETSERNCARQRRQVGRLNAYAR